MFVLITVSVLLYCIRASDKIDFRWFFLFVRLWNPTKEPNICGEKQQKRALSPISAETSKTAQSRRLTCQYTRAVCTASHLSANEAKKKDEKAAYIHSSIFEPPRGVEEGARRIEMPVNVNIAGHGREEKLYAFGLFRRILLRPQLCERCFLLLQLRSFCICMKASARAVCRRKRELYANRGKCKSYNAVFPREYIYAVKNRIDREAYPVCCRELLGEYNMGDGTISESRCVFCGYIDI